MDKPKSVITIIKRCRVCGDQALSYNFNGLSCESCKAFFRRVAFKNDLKCENGNTCEINRSTRTNCRKCRFDKCVATGMKKELVSCLSKRTNLTPKPDTTVLPIDRNRLLSNERTLNLKMYELSRLVELHKAVQAFPSESSWQIVGQVENVPQMINLSAVNIKFIIRFCKNIGAFNFLSKDEQVIALKSLVPEINQINAAFIYNTETKGWAALEDSDCDKRALFVKLDFFKNLSSDEMFNFFSNFIIDLHREMENDSVICDLILAKLVFKHRPKMDSFEFMQYHSVVFHYLLRRYLEHKYLDKNRASQKYTNLMGLLVRMDTIANAIGEFFSKTHIQTTQVTPVVRAIYNLDQI